LSTCGPDPEGVHEGADPLLRRPPGVGKTSLASPSPRPGAEVYPRFPWGCGTKQRSGHRRTYIEPCRADHPGDLSLRANNPVFMLDEVDKIGLDFRGDPASALLEVLDPEQNATFTDHYLDVAYDLSKVMFITTANQLDPVPLPQGPDGGDHPLRLHH